MLKSVQLGKNSGLRVSKLCLGTMNLGEAIKAIGHSGQTMPDQFLKQPLITGYSILIAQIPTVSDLVSGSWDSYYVSYCPAMNMY